MNIKCHEDIFIATMNIKYGQEAEVNLPELYLFSLAQTIQESKSKLEQIFYYIEHSKSVCDIFFE